LRKRKGHLGEGGSLFSREKKGKLLTKGKRTTEGRIKVRKKKGDRNVSVKRKKGRLKLGGEGDEPVV